MLRQPILVLILLCSYTILHAQPSPKGRIIILQGQAPSAFPVKGGTLYFLDSIRVTYDRDKTTLSPSDVADMHIITDKDSIRLLRFGRYDTIVYLYTKAYMQRPALQRSIPSTKQLYQWRNNFYYRGDPYTGKVIDYYVDGTIRYRGTIEKGKRIGTHYYYLKDGTMQKLVFNHRGFKEEERWYNAKDQLYKKIVRKKDVLVLEETYYNNGQLQMSHSHPEEGKSIYVSWFSNGKLRDSSVIELNGKRSSYRRSPRIAGLKQLIEDKDFTRAIELDAKNPDIYSYRAYIEADSLQFDAALQDIDLAISLETNDHDFFGQRAYTRIRKYAYLAGQKVVDPHQMLDYLATGPELNIPEEDMKKIRYDLYKAYALPGFLKNGDYLQAYEYLTK